MNALVRALLVLVVLAAVVGGVLAYSVVSRGLSTRSEPSRVEAMLAGGMRRLATPRGVRAMTTRSNRRMNRRTATVSVTISTAIRKPTSRWWVARSTIARGTRGRET